MIKINYYDMMRRHLGLERCWHLKGIFDNETKEAWCYSAKEKRETLQSWRYNNVIEIVEATYLRKGKKIKYMVAHGTPEKKRR